MKRDIELFRLILLKLEAMKPSDYLKPIEIDGYDQDVVNYHTWYLHEEGFIEAIFIKADQAPFGILNVIPKESKNVDMNSLMLQEIQPFGRKCVRQ